MTSILFPVILVSVVSLLSMVVMYAVATRANELQPATVDPFRAPGTSDPASDTLSNDAALIKTTLITSTEWQITTVESLSQATDMLDSLEAHGVAEREVVVLADDRFAVRWR